MVVWAPRAGKRAGRARNMSTAPSEGVVQIDATHRTLCIMRGRAVQRNGKRLGTRMFDGIKVAGGAGPGGAALGGVMADRGACRAAGGTLGRVESIQ